MTKRQNNQKKCIAIFTQRHAQFNISQHTKKKRALFMAYLEFTHCICSMDCSKHTHENNICLLIGQWKKNTEPKIYHNGYHNDSQFVFINNGWFFLHESLNFIIIMNIMMLYGLCSSLAVSLATVFIQIFEFGIRGNTIFLQEIQEEIKSWFRGKCKKLKFQRISKLSINCIQETQLPMHWNTTQQTIDYPVTIWWHETWFDNFVAFLSYENAFFLYFIVNK